MPRFVRQRLLVLVGVGLVLVVLVVVLGVDARARANEGLLEQRRTARIARVMGLPELALSTSSTWLRHPALAAPSAATADAPLGLDQDPAGSVLPRRGRERTLEMRREGRAP